MADRNRRKAEPRHIRLYHSVTGSEAWRHLSGNGIKVLLALLRIYNGGNNGELFFSDRKGAEESGLSRNTVRRALVELMDKGFIVCTKPGSFKHKQLQAATYRLTWLPWPGGNPAAPTRDFEKWKHAEISRAQFPVETGSIFATEVETDSADGSKFEPDNLETSLVSANLYFAGIEPQVFSHGLQAESHLLEQRKQANSSRAAFLAFLRSRLAEHLSGAEPGEQSRLAKCLEIPGGTLSKFINGRGLPEHHADRLARALQREAA